MARKKNEDERQIKLLEEQIRELKAVNRILHRKLKRINKGYRKYREEKEPEEELVVEEKMKCPDCSSDVKTHDLMGRYWDYCTSCGWRSAVRQ